MSHFGKKKKKKDPENVEIEINLRKVGCLKARDLRDNGISEYSPETDTEALQLRSSVEMLFQDAGSDPGQGPEAAGSSSSSL